MVTLPFVTGAFHNAVMVTSRIVATGTTIVSQVSSNIPMLELSSTVGAFCNAVTDTSGRFIARTTMMPKRPPSFQHSHFHPPAYVFHNAEAVAASFFVTSTMAVPHASIVTLVLIPTSSLVGVDHCLNSMTAWYKTFVT